LSLSLNKVLATSAQAMARNPATLLIAAGVLLSVALLASLLPAWKAASIDPMKAIRTE
jgi:ABC-type antimicrobial peptide transport system permease subunit